MANYTHIRDELAARRVALLRRVDAIEADIERQAKSGSAWERGATADFASPPSDPGESGESGESIWESATELATLIETSRRELGLIDASLRRIADRTFDCCITCGSTIPEAVLVHSPYAVNCEACSSGFDADYFQRVRAQHEGLHRSLGAVRAAMSAVIDSTQHEDSAPAHGQSAVRVLLGILRRELAEHFELEEDGGYLSEAIAVAPWLERKANGLEAQHPAMLEHLNRIVAAADDCGNEAARWSRVESAFHQLTLDLLRHERAESDIVSQAFLDDIGSAGD